MALLKLNSKALLLLLSFLFIVFACSDNSMKPDSDPPIIPELEDIAPDIGFFESNTPGQGSFDELYSNYYEGSTYALAGNSTFGLFTLFPALYLSMTDEVEPKFIKGKWVWTFGYSFEGESFELRIEADVDNGKDRVDWEIYLSIDSFDIEFNLDNFLFLKGFTSINANIGEWNFFIPFDSDDESVGLTSKWNIQSATEKDMEVRISRTYEDSEFVMEYRQRGTEYWMDYSDFFGPEIIQVYWNTANNTGYVQIDNDRKCWSENFRNVESCP